MAAEGQEVTAGAAAVLARRKDRPPLPRSLREAANEETSDEEWCAERVFRTRRVRLIA